MDFGNTNQTAYENGTKVPTCQFDFREVDKRLGESPETNTFAIACEFFLRIDKWITKGGTAYTAGCLTRREIYIWIVNPGRYDFCTQEELAGKLRISRDRVNRIVADFKRTFNFLPTFTRPL